MNKLFCSCTVAAVAALMIGCGETGDMGNTIANESTPSVADQIKKIEADPNMPQPAKDAAIGQLKARADQAQGRADAAANGAKK